MTTSPTSPTLPSPSRKKRRWARLRKVVFWSLVLLLSLAAAITGFAYAFVTDSETLASLVRREAPRFFPGSNVEVGRVRIRPFLGEVTLERLRLRQRIGPDRSVVTGQVDWVSVKHDLQALTRGEFKPREVVLVKPVLRVKRLADGSWNLQTLLADPWPAPPLDVEPVILVRDGTLELIEGPGDDAAPVMVLQSVSMRADPTHPGGPMRITGEARGGPFDRFRFEGLFNTNTGRLDLTRGDVTGLTLTESFCRCLPDDALQAAFRGLGLSGGEVDVTLRQLVYEPASNAPPKYAADMRLRGATLRRDELPFVFNSVEAVATVEDGVLRLESAEGRYGKTLVSVTGTLSADDPENGPLDLNVAVTDLELDDRLRTATPEEFETFWEEFEPSGWINAGVRLIRPEPGAEVGFGMTLSCRDVSIRHFKFPYPVQHIRGLLRWQGDTIDVDMETVVGGSRMTGKGTVRNPGPNALVDMDFTAGAMPIDATLIDALPPEIAQVVREFEPSGSVRGVVHLQRRPPGTPEAHPKADRDGTYMHAELDLNPGASIRWIGMPYLVDNLTGHLDLKPDRWTFQNMKGRNGPAILEADGEVVDMGPGDPAVTLHIKADRLPFDQQLRNALPPEWQQTWATLNPSGFSKVEAHITTIPGREPHYHMTVVPDPAETRVRLVLTPVIVGPDGTPEAWQEIRLPPMEHVSGNFVFDNGTVTMNDVRCVFREAPVGCKSGTVVLQDTGAFHLAAQDLMVSKLRLDAELRKIMPPVMAEFAQRLDDGRTLMLRGDMTIDWTGEPGVPARCAWENGIVVLNGNTIQTGLPLEDLQGEVRDLQGWSDGQDLSVRGFVDLASIKFQDQQITQLRSPLEIDQGWARFDDIQGNLLGGQAVGRVAVSLDTTPRYTAKLELTDADLTRYTMTLPGRQTTKGKVSGWVDLAGEGNDLRTVSGYGYAQVAEGDLGQLPLALRWAKVPNFRPPTKTAFDAVQIGIQLGNGQAVLDPIKLTGDAFSLLGSGTVELLGEQKLDLRLSPLYGRSERPLPLVGPAMREATGRFVDIHVTGPLSSPEIDPEPLPDVWTRASAAFNRLTDRDTPEQRANDRLRDWERGRARLWDSDRRRSPDMPTSPFANPFGSSPPALPELPVSRSTPARAPTVRPTLLGRLRAGDPRF